jgi:hypothetical protein
VIGILRPIVANYDDGRRQRIDGFPFRNPLTGADEIQSTSGGHRSREFAAGADPIGASTINA